MLLSNSTSNGPVITVQDGSNNKNKVTDIFTWFLSWSLFFQASLIFRAHLAEKMAQYQLFTAQLVTVVSKVTDIFTWFLSWSLFFQASLIFRAHLAEKMANYLLPSW